MRRSSFNIELLDETFNGAVYYRELANYMKRRGEYERSLEFYDKSVKRNGDDIKARMGRATARANSNRFAEAVNDINLLLNIDPDNIYIKSDNAQIIYSGCEFENALIENYRDVPLRQKPENFLDGILLCEEAINNSTSNRAGHPLRDHFKIIRKMAWHKTIREQRPFKPVARNRILKKKTISKSLPSTMDKMKQKRDKKKRIHIENMDRKVSYVQQSRRSETKLPSRSFTAISEVSSIKDSLNSHSSSLENLILPPSPYLPHKPAQKYTSNLQRYLAEKYLGRLCYDKTFLQKLMCHSGTTTANEKGSKRIKRLIQQSYNSVCNTQEILRARRPFYHIKFQENEAYGNLEQRMLEVVSKQQKNAVKQAETLLKKVEEAARNRQLLKTLEESERLFGFCENTPKKIFPTRKEYILKMADIFSNAMYDVIKFPKNMTAQQKENRVKFLIGLPSLTSYSKDYIANELKYYYVDFKKLTILNEKRLYKAESPQELAWLYHELCRSTFRLKKYEASRMYARKCIEEAHIAKNYKWIICALLVVAKVDIIQKDKNSAENQVGRAREIAMKLQDDEMVNLLTLAVRMVEETSLYDDQSDRILERRQNQMIKLLNPPSLKQEGEVFFRRLKMLPLEKRMSVMPGFTYTENQDKEEVDGAQKGSKAVSELIAKLPKNNSERGVSILNFDLKKTKLIKSLRKSKKI